MSKNSCRPTQGRVLSGFRCVTFWQLQSLVLGHHLILLVITCCTAFGYRVPWTSQARSSIWRRSWWRRASTQIKLQNRSTFWMTGTRITSHLHWKYSAQWHQGRSKFKAAVFVSTCLHCDTSAIWIVVVLWFVILSFDLRDCELTQVFLVPRGAGDSDLYTADFFLYDCWMFVLTYLPLVRAETFQGNNTFNYILNKCNLWPFCILIKKMCS